MLLVMDIIIFAVLFLIVAIPYEIFENIFKLW